jgi:hypothetical protein
MGSKRTVRMHREILGALSDKQVDHINLNTLDNRKCNLRLASHQENIWNRAKTSRNTVGYKGVYRCSGSRRFRAMIQKNGNLRHLGCFDTREEAAIAYNHAAIEAFGEFANLNAVRSSTPETPIAA